MTTTTINPQEVTELFARYRKIMEDNLAAYENIVAEAPDGEKKAYAKGRRDELKVRLEINNGLEMEFFAMGEFQDSLRELNGVLAKKGVGFVDARKE